MTDPQPYEAGGPAPCRSRRWLARGGIAAGGAASLVIGAVLGGMLEGIPVVLAHHDHSSALQVQSRPGIQVPLSVEQAAYTMPLLPPVPDHLQADPATAVVSVPAPPGHPTASSGAPVAPTPAPATPPVSPRSQPPSQPPSQPAAPPATSVPVTTPPTQEKASDNPPTPSPSIVQALVGTTVTTLGQTVGAVADTVSGAVPQTSGTTSQTSGTTSQTTATAVSAAEQTPTASSSTPLGSSSVVPGW